ncbi:S1 RNA-binding domain-containing protein 1-like [Anneissia japonica]|uniref:S1 RNA-binding domain-containing protein 1-like n=1 Tax=Anneissia japonica TaxID=1529436 RepID=UPI0014257DDE|nr:S1 RNA-binding domain-containing protein 1-like [Anneissia japonica]XP_033125801.1 S1 RNA-binding domain-containing protein 1-like [Anneissia japonica]XP_033125802.1 S1 RNA-binding domain-containing protein 1-like [Anneissia japonica]XP_033125803.1 S1 RNA-binding domain-containing protein 1-like [Anneissia japonica]
MDGKDTKKGNKNKRESSTAVKREVKRRKRAQNAETEELDVCSKPATSTTTKEVPVLQPKKSKSKTKEKEGGRSNKSDESRKNVKTLDEDVLHLGERLFEIISTQVNEPYWAVVNVVKLLDSDHTVPFIARYRKEQTNNMEVKQIREVQFCLIELRLVESKASNIFKQITKQGKMTTGVRRSIQRAHSIEELDHIFAPFKTGSKSSLAERAKKAGLEPAAMRVLNNDPLNLHEFVSSTVDGCCTMEKVKQGIQHILADIIAKDKDTMDQIRLLTSDGRTLITAEKSKSALKDEKEKNMCNRHFENYFNFKVPAKDIKPHQVLALNRGDALKELSVKLELSPHVCKSFKSWCLNRWIPKFSRADGKGLLTSAIDDAYKRLIQPLIVRQIRSELTRSAERASIDVFAQNLKRLLLTPPVRGKVIIGLDPGFRNGCKAAIISETGVILHTDVLYLINNQNQHQKRKLVDMVQRFKAATVAIGNGTACRETEKVIADLISKKTFYPLDVKYCIVNEDGASIYSVSEEAEKEMPDLDPNVRSAVSIARRLQDPLVELVKNNPKHIGVGMYQHDMPEKLMKTALDGVVEDCVSFVGVDLNVCTESLLRRIAGLTATRAKNIIEFREKNGGFVNREQLLEIKGIWTKTYEQCAGFVRISRPINPPCNSQRVEDTSGTVPVNTRTRKTKSKVEKVFEANPLDKTWIHPESYSTATEFLDMIGEGAECIGLPTMSKKIDNALKKSGIRKFADDLDVGVHTMELIIDGLKQPIGYDIRAEYDKPLFKVGIMSMDDLKCGSVYPGRVTNVTHFGVFVDIGVQKSGLIHTSKIPQHLVAAGRQFGPGDKVEVMVLNIDKERQRIQLQLVNLP